MDIIVRVTRRQELDEQRDQQIHNTPKPSRLYALTAGLPVDFRGFFAYLKRQEALADGHPLREADCRQVPCQVRDVNRSLVDAERERDVRERAFVVVDDAHLRELGDVDDEQVVARAMR